MSPLRSWFLAALCVGAVAPGCGPGTGGTITVPCDVTRCNETCVADGSASGECRDDACVCVPAIRPPSGPTLGLSSGGVVERRSSGYSVELSVGPVAPAAVPVGPVDVELGLEPQTDPTRTP